MAKRLNPHRRLLARQAALIRECKQAEASRLGVEQGRVRCALNTKFSVGYHSPKFLALPHVPPKARGKAKIYRY